MLWIQAQCPNGLASTYPRGFATRDGPFAHQGEAVDAWCDAGCRGVLEMATGAGKTIAAMIAALQTPRRASSAPYRRCSTVHTSRSTMV